jgi:hypothetical protein
MERNFTRTTKYMCDRELCWSAGDKVRYLWLRACVPRARESGSQEATDHISIAKLALADAVLSFCSEAISAHGSAIRGS